MPYRIADPETPVTENVDLSSSLLSEVPQFVAFKYWITTAGGASAGAISMDFSWTDLDGQSRIVNGSPISLQDGAGSFISPTFLMDRQSSSSQLDLVKTLIGAADGAEVRYGILTSSGASSDVGTF